MESIKEVLRREIVKESDAFNPYVQFFRKNIPAVKAVILYGSCVNEATRKPTSFPDFYVLVENFRGAFKRRKVLNRILVSFLVPSSYFLFERKGEELLKAKYQLVSFKRFIKEISEKPSDMYNLGRFGKKTIVLYWEDDETLNALLNAMEKAFHLNALVAAGLMKGRFSTEEMVFRILQTSYRADFRVERDTKVMELFNAEKTFYLKIYPTVLKDLSSTHRWLKKEEGGWHSNPPLLLRLKFLMFIYWSKVSSVLRWPKGIITFDNYVDYLIEKVERAKGIKIELTEKERKYPLIFGWKYFFSLLRRGMIK